MARDPGTGTGPLVGGGTAPPPPAASGGGGGGGGGGVVNWLGISGLPQDLINAVDAIFRDGAPNPSERALAYLRTTPWHEQKYPGFWSGSAGGLFSSEAEYMNWLGGINAAYRRFNGRDVNSQELWYYAAAGWGAGEIGQRLEFGAGFKEMYRRHYGRDATQAEIDAYYGSGGNLDTLSKIYLGEEVVGAERGDVQYLSGAFGEGRLSEEQLTAYGQQKAGLNSALGGQILDKVGKAIQKVNRVFQGEAATQIGSQDILASGLKRRPDVGR